MPAPGRRASTWRSPSTAPPSGQIPYLWIPEAARLLRPGGRLVFLTNATSGALPGRSRATRSASARLRPLRVPPARVARRDGVHVFQLPLRRLDPPPPGERLRGRGPDRAPAAAEASRPGLLGLRHGRVGAQLALPRRSGRPEAAVSVRPPAPPLLLASTSPQRPAILAAARDSVRRRRLRDTRSTTRPASTRSTSCARTRAERRGRSRARPATGRCSASTRPSSLGGRVLGKPAGPEEAERDARRARRPDARGRLGPLPRDAGLGARRARRHPRHLPGADAARPGRLHRDGRVGGPGGRATRSRASAPRSSSGSRATT